MKYEIIKGSEKDFEGAPEWAIMAVVFDGAGGHGIDFSDGMSEGARVFYSHSKKETEIVFPRHWKIIAERRPITEPVWDVSAPPPVGIECEVLFTSEGSVFERARILHAGDDGIVGRWLTGDSAGGLFDYMYIPHEYRPIRSPEDVARSNAIGEVERAYEELTGNPGREAEEYYDLIAAGKIPGITKTPTVSELMRVTENATREDCEAIVKMLGGGHD
ncbi:MAG: hypothetical protein [Bacteriophage sp.]|nr:MAG: hypothetical protein [Bacteriophage sp.]